MPFGNIKLFLTVPDCGFPCNSVMRKCKIEVEIGKVKRVSLFIVSIFLHMSCATQIGFVERESCRF